MFVMAIWDLISTARRKLIKVWHPNDQGGQIEWLPYLAQKYPCRTAVHAVWDTTVDHVNSWPTNYILDQSTLSCSLPSAENITAGIPEYLPSFNLLVRS